MREVVFFSFGYSMLAAWFCYLLFDCGVKHPRTIALFWLPIMVAAIAIAPFAMLLCGGDCKRLERLWNTATGDGE